MSDNEPNDPIVPNNDDGEVRTEEITEAPAEMTAEELAEAKRYGRASLACGLIDRAVDIGYLAIAAFFLGKPLDDWLMTCPVLSEWDTLRLLMLFVLVTVGHMVVSFPLSFYSGHVLEHKFALSKLTFGGWLWRYCKRMGLAVAFGAALFTGLYWLIWLTGAYWWLAAAGAFFLVSIILGQLAPVLIMPLFYTIEKLDRPELAERLGKLSEGTGLSIEGIYRIALSEETVKANAMLAGMGATRRVLMGDTLLERFSDDEIEVIFAHEIGHHVHRHLPKLIGVGFLFSVAGFWICARVVAAWVGAGGVPIDYAHFPVWALPMIMFVLTLFPTILEPLQNAVSRVFERQADRYALKRTDLRDEYVAAFQKLSKLNKDDPDPHPLEVFLFHSHPPIGERVRMAEGSKG